jgi:ketosteroid isomerase-like protein
MRYYLYGILLFCLCCGTTLAESIPAAAVKNAADQFTQTIQTHIEAISSRDLDGILATITEGERLILIFPDGTTLTSRQQYLEFHQQWFADDSWSMHIEPVLQEVNGNHGVALVRTTYTDEAGSRLAMLALHFGLENEEWRLFFDQNTRIVTDN